MTYRSDSSSPFSRILGPLRARQCACHSAQCQRLHQRVTEDLSRRHFLGGMAAMLAPFALPSAAMAAATALADDARPLLLTNLRLFDGSGTAAREGVQVLVKKRIADLLPESATVEGARVLDCQGKLLLPGLIDVHWHTMLAAIPQMTAMTADLGYLYRWPPRKPSAR